MTSWFPSITEMFPMSVQKQFRRTGAYSAAGSPALVRYHNPKNGPKYPEVLTHLPFRTRPSTEWEYFFMESVHKKIGYEEIDTLPALHYLSKALPSGKWFIIHPLSRSRVEILEMETLKALQTWIKEKDIYKGTDVQSQIFLEARKETLERVDKELFKREAERAEVYGIFDWEWDHDGFVMVLDNNVSKPPLGSRFLNLGEGVTEEDSEEDEEAEKDDEENEEDEGRVVV